MTKNSERETERVEIESTNRKMPNLRNTLKVKRNYNLAHSKSRVSNVLGKPGSFAYTDKEQINTAYKRAIDKLKELENPKETMNTFESFVGKVEALLHSKEAKETGAIVLTLPVGLAQGLTKGIRFFLSALLFFAVDIPSMGSLPTSAYVLPDQYFNTTHRAYSKMRKFTGANGLKRNK